MASVACHMLLMMTVKPVDAKPLCNSDISATTCQESEMQPCYDHVLYLCIASNRLKQIFSNYGRILDKGSFVTVTYQIIQGAASTWYPLILQVIQVLFISDSCSCLASKQA